MVILFKKAFTVTFFSRMTKKKDILYVFFNCFFCSFDGEIVIYALANLVGINKNLRHFRAYTSTRLKSIVSKNEPMCIHLVYFQFFSANFNFKIRHILDVFK